MHLKIALLGFSDFERGTLGSYFRLAADRTPRYEQVHMLTDADYLVADADHQPSVQLVVATERLAETVFVGAKAPAGATAWTRRPIDPLHVLRELDALVLLGSAFSDEADLSGAGEGPDEWLVSLRTLDDVPPAPPPGLLPPPAPPSQPFLLERAAQAAAFALPSPSPSPPAAARALPSPAPLPPVQRSPLMQSPAAAPLPAPSRALLVDDSEIALRFLETRLKPWGLLVDRAGGSDRALELLGKRNYDYVFLDIELGEGSELDGLALCRHIKHSPATLNAMVIVVSAHHSELDRVRGALAGCDAYLGKPLDAAELSRLLQRQGLKPPPAAAAQAATRPN